MRKLLIPLRKGLALFLATYFFFATLPLKSEPIAPLDKENVRLSLVVVSDVHTETNSLARFKVNMQSMKHFAAVKDTADALLLLGDNTMNGQKLENLFLYGMLETVNPIKPYYTIVGNHDIGNVSEPDGSFPSFRETQLDYMQTFVDRSVEELYYSETVNGESEDFPTGSSTGWRRSCKKLPPTKSRSLCAATIRCRMLCRATTALRSLSRSIPTRSCSSATCIITSASA